MPVSADNKWLCVDLPVIPYRQGLNLQQNLVDARCNDVIDRDIVLLLEHAAVFTLGRRGGLDNLKVSESFLAANAIEVLQAERGGDITFHGPGQLVVYPIIDLNKAGLQVIDYVSGLEETMLRAAADWGVQADRRPANRGIWVGNRKLGSIGICVRRDVCFHGMALNVDLALQPFDWINPCGLQGCRVTSMARELSQAVSVSQVRRAVKHHLQAVFGISLVPAGPPELSDLLLQSGVPSLDPNLICPLNTRKHATEVSPVL